VESEESVSAFEVHTVRMMLMCVHDFGILRIPVSNVHSLSAVNPLKIVAATKRGT